MKARFSPKERNVVEGALRALLHMIGDKMVNFHHHSCSGCGTYRRQGDATCGLCPDCVSVVEHVVGRPRAKPSARRST